MMAWLRDESGETLVETLCSLLIITLAMLGLASALMGASRANTAFDADDVSFSMTGSKSMGDGSIRFKADGKPDVIVDVDMFETGGGYAYYDEKD